MTTEQARLCDGCPARDNPKAQRLIGELGLRGIECSEPIKDGNPFTSVRFNQPMAIRISCGIETAIEQYLSSRGIELTDELINKIACGDFSVLDQAT